MTSSRRPQVTVIGNAEASEHAIRLARSVGEMVANLGCILVSGGRGGVMGAASQGARQAGGLVVGVLPSAEMAEGNPYLDVVIPTGIGYARNVTNVLSADVVVAIGGGAGTLSEIAYAWMYGKTIIAMTGAGGWADELAGRPIDDRRSDVVIRVESLEGLAVEVRNRLKTMGFSVEK